MPGGRDLVGGGVRERDDGRWPFLPGSVEGKGAVQGVRGGYVAWVNVGAHMDTTWAGRGWNMKLGSHTPCQETADVPDGIPDRRRNAELPS